MDAPCFLDLPSGRDRGPGSPSANFAFYGDISERMRSLAAGNAHKARMIATRAGRPGPALNRHYCLLRKIAKSMLLAMAS